ncbi:MAG TPA: hypothetical protein VJZ52_01725 [Candidatus Paceibacterota bacterium]|nr:hypothetical protein [Candidatus Paceibacterota bacterium]
MSDANEVKKESTPGSKGLEELDFQKDLGGWFIQRWWEVKTSDLQLARYFSDHIVAQEVARQKGGVVKPVLVLSHASTHDGFILDNKAIVLTDISGSDFESIRTMAWIRTQLSPDQWSVLLSQLK